MNKVIAICGKVGSGKTYYARQLMQEQNAVLLSNDELLHDLFPGKHPGNQQELMGHVNGYLLKKAAEIAANGCTVILDWGFWKRQEREELTRYFQESGVPVQWYYAAVDEETWRRNIAKRNQEVQAHDDGSSFVLGEEILARADRIFEVPASEENMIVLGQTDG